MVSPTRPTWPTSVRVLAKKRSIFCSSFEAHGAKIGINEYIFINNFWRGEQPAISLQTCAAATVSLPAQTTK